MENFAVVALAESLKSAMGDVLIRRVVQHQPNGFIFQTRASKLPGLKVIMDAHSPALYASEAKAPVEAPASDFLMVLRKHLTSAEVVGFSKPLSERIIEIVFKTVVPSKELEVMTLVVELLPNAPNMILLDVERRLIASFAPLTPQHNTGEFDVYTLPATGEKIPLEKFLEEAPLDLTGYAGQENPQRWLISHIAGMGPALAAEIVFRQRKSEKPLQMEMRELLLEIMTPSHGAWIYTDLPLGHILEQNDLKRLEKAIISPINLHSLERSHSSRLFPNILEAARFYCDELETRGALEHAKLPILRDMRTALKRITDKEKRLLAEQRKYEDAQNLQRNAQMLVSSGMKPDQRYENVTVTNYFAEKPGDITIALDPALTLRENIEKMFKRYSKAERGTQMVREQLGRIRNRHAAITEQLRRLQGIKDWDTWHAIATRIEKEQAGLSPRTSQDAAQEREKPRKRFRSAMLDGYEVLVGRSSRENDELTFRVAAPDDFWFHVSDYSGSHVVVRNPEHKRDLEEAVLTKAAQLAAFFSQARNSSKVEVHYTRRKHVAKPRRGKPGLARLMEFKSITVEPRNWLED